MDTQHTGTLSEEQIAQYRKDGFIVVPGLLTEEEADAFVEYEKLPKPEGWRQDLRNHAHDEKWAYIARHPKVVSAIEQLVGAPADIVQTMYLEKQPAKDGEKAGTGVAMHQDLHYLPCEPETLLACWIALSDTDAENGGLCVVPESQHGPLHSTHQADNTDEHDSWEIIYDMRDKQGKEWKERMYSFEIDGLKDESIVRLTVPKGAGVIFDGKTIHGSFGNKSKTRPRLAFATHYVREGSWLFRTDVQETVPARK